MSFALTVTQALLENNGLDTRSITRLEVGTETILDHSKSIKTHLLDLFPDNPFLEGVDCINACFGATQALFNTVDYIRLHGGYGIVVATDVSVYGGPVCFMSFHFFFIVLIC